MIHVVEISENAKAQAWFAYDEHDFVRKVQVRFDTPEWQNWVLYQCATPRQMVAKGEDANLLAEHFGWDTPLYRADFLLEHGQYQLGEIPEFKACLAAVVNTCHDWRIYLDDESAADALLIDQLFQGRDGLQAHIALREQLIAMEILADDF